MSRTHLNDVEHYLSRAEEYLVIADGLREGPREQMLAVALDYQKLAERAMDRLRTNALVRLAEHH